MKPDSGEREVWRCVHGFRRDLIEKCAADSPAVVVPLPLARRILAALEQCDQFWSGFDGRALASELRAAVERKP